MRALLLIACLALWPLAACADPVPTVFLAGDSTMSIKRAEKRPETGWGEAFEAQFQPGRIRLDNRAMNGRSTRSFIEEGRWQDLLDEVGAGDYVFIQFGHNDQSRHKADRYTPPPDYRRNLEGFVDQVRERGATAILLTPVARRRFDRAGAVLDSHSDYPGLVRQVAAERAVALIDMERRSQAVLGAWGDAGSKALFLWLQAGEHGNYPEGLRDDTHFSPQGARCMAAEVADGLRLLGLPLSASLKPPARCLRPVPAGAAAARPRAALRG